MSAVIAQESLAEALPPIKGFMFDLDGTLLLSDRSLGGYEVLPGAVEVLTKLKERATPFVILTNGSAYPPAEQAAKLRSNGLPGCRRHVLRSREIATPVCSCQVFSSVLAL